MGLADLAQPLGISPAWRNDMWPCFVYTALHLLRDALERFLRTTTVNVAWTENKFSWEFLKHIDAVKHEAQLPISIQDEARLGHHDDADEDPDKAARIDLALRHFGMARAKYLGVEAKVLTRETLGSRDPGKTFAYYVDEGIMRFVAGKYAGGLPEGVMLGFLLCRAPGEYAEEINARIRQSSVPCTCPLIVANDPVHDGHFGSIHPRASAPIYLHHLLLPVYVPVAGHRDHAAVRLARSGGRRGKKK